MQQPKSVEGAVCCAVPGTAGREPESQRATTEDVTPDIHTYVCTRVNYLRTAPAPGKIRARFNFRSNRAKLRKCKERVFINMPTPLWPTIYAPRSHLDLLLELRGAIACEWWVPAQQQVGDDPDAPHVARSREVGAADHLRRHVHLSPKIEYNRMQCNARGYHTYIRAYEVTNNQTSRDVKRL